MKITNLELKGAAIIETNPFEDERGAFARLFCQKDLESLHEHQSIDQINYSHTIKKGTIRGLHFQKPPFCEIKLIRCIKGKIFDVIVDIRKNSPTFLKWHGEELSENNMKMLYVPKGFAHGFQTLEDNCELLYLHSEFYNPKAENGLFYNDPLLNIKWPLKTLDLSKRDKKFSLINNDFLGLKL